MTDTPASALSGGIDLGGTKIETALFEDGDLVGVARRRPTPTESYQALIEALAEEMATLRHMTNVRDLPIGIGAPGIVNPNTGVLAAANLVADGKALGRDLSAATGITPIIENDAAAFTVSEARGGAGDGRARVFGLVLGTGIGGALCHRGQVDRGAAGIAGELGHIPLPAHLVAEHNLPLVRCGCGRLGCMETLVSGPGLARLLEHRTGRVMTAQDIAAEPATPAIAATLDVWFDLCADLIRTIRIAVDPDCIVLGGGVSSLKGLCDALRKRIATPELFGAAPPDVHLAHFGAASGVRGAALLARAGQAGA